MDKALCILKNFMETETFLTKALKHAKKNEEKTEIFINLGEEHGLDWTSLKDFIRDNVGLDKDDVFRVDVKESFSFFNTEAEHTEKILAHFTEFKENGRFINVEISSNPGGGGGRGRRNRDGGGRGRSRDRGRSGGRDRDSNRGGDRKYGRRSSSSRNDSGGSGRRNSKRRY